MTEKPYHIIHSNVDGAGSMPGSYDTLERAKEAAIRYQMTSDRLGNPWSYQYHVSGYGRQLYSTQPGEQLEQKGHP